MTRIFTIMAGWLGALCVAACASSPTPGGIGGFEVIGTVATPSESLLMNADEYTLGPYDKIGINVYQMPALTFQEIQIDATGQIILPQIGLIPVAGRTVPQVTADINARLSECCLVNPQVIVTLREAVSQRITVTGAVRNPANYPVRGRTTLLQAINMANGPDLATADLRQVAIIRTSNGQRLAAKFDLDAINRGRVDDPEVIPGDVVFVDTSSSKSAVRTALQAIPFMGVFTIF